MQDIFDQVEQANSLDIFDQVAQSDPPQLDIFDEVASQETPVEDLAARKERLRSKYAGVDELKLNPVQSVVSVDVFNPITRAPGVAPELDALEAQLQQSQQPSTYSLGADIKQAGKEIAPGLVRGAETASAALGAPIQAIGDYLQTQARQFRNIRQNIKDKIYPPKPVPNERELRAPDRGVGGMVSDSGQTVYDFWNEAANTGWEKRDPKIYEGDFTKNPSIARVVGGASESAVPMFAAMGLSAAGMPGAGAALMANSDAGPVYFESKAKGARDGDAFSYALLTGIGTAALERTGLDVVMNKNPAIKALVAKMGKPWVAGALTSMAAEGSTEALQQLYQNAVAMGYDGDQQLFEGVLESGIVGAVAGGGMSAVHSTAQKITKEYYAAQADKAKGLTPQQIDAAVREAYSPRNGVVLNPDGTEFSFDQGRGNINVAQSQGEPNGQDLQAAQTLQPEQQAASQGAPQALQVPGLPTEPQAVQPIEIQRPVLLEVPNEPNLSQGQVIDPFAAGRPEGQAQVPLQSVPAEEPNQQPTPVPGAGAQDAITVVPYPSDPQASPSLEQQASERKQGGFIARPSLVSVQKAGRFLRKWFLPSGNMDSVTRAANLERKQAQEAAKMEGLLTRREFQQARKSLTGTFGKDVVQSAMEGVVYGDMTVADFAKQFSLPADHVAVKTLDRFVSERDSNQAKMADLLQKTGNDSLSERVREHDNYVSRFYLKHALGDEFQPNPKDYEAAVFEIKAGIEDLIQTTLDRANKAAGKSFSGQVTNYLNTGNESILTGLSDSRAKELVLLRRQFVEISQVINSVQDNNGTIEFQQNLEAIQDAAQATIEFYLKREQGRGAQPDIQNLKKRFLGEAFRKLYGEVSDPIFAAAATMENQSRLLSQLAFFNTLTLQAENKSWSRMPSDKLGTTVRLQDDRKRYGLLAGAYVTPELNEAIHGGAVDGAIMRGYLATVGTMRLLKLIGPKTIVRNYTTGLTGFALGSGDLFLPGYMKHFSDAHKLVADFVKGSPEATATFRDLVNLGVFSFRGNTQMNEVQRLFTLDPRKRLAAGIDKLGDFYSLIDLPTKVAAYRSQLDRFVAQGMPLEQAQKQAANHVQQFYQNPNQVPKVAKSMSRMPLADYPGYFFDAARIRINQVKYAAQSAKDGNLIPGIGLMLSGMLSAGIAYGFGQVGRELWRKARLKLRSDDEEKQVLSADEIEKAKQLAVREFMPSYYESAPVIFWQEKRKDGTQRLYYSVTGGNGAFPLEDILYGAMQSSQSAGETAKTFGKEVVKSRLGLGMLPQALYKAATGDSPQSKFFTDGIVDVIGRNRPDKDKIFRRSAVNLLSDVLGGQFGSKLMQSYALQEKEQSGVKPVAGSYTPYNTQQSIWGSMIDPVRTYEINSEEAARLVMARIRPYSEGISVAKNMAGSEVRAEVQKGGATQTQKEEAALGQESRRQYIEEVRGIIERARLAFGGVLTEDQLRAVVKDAFPSANRVEYIRMVSPLSDRKVPDYKPEAKPGKLQRLMNWQE